MSKFHGTSAGDTLQHVLHQGGGALLLAVPKDAERAEYSTIGRLIIATRETVGISDNGVFMLTDCVGLWTPFEYFNNTQKTPPRQVWRPGIVGFGVPIVFLTTDFLLRASRPSEHAYLAVKYYAHYDAFLSGSKSLIIDEATIQALVPDVIHQVGSWLHIKNVPPIKSITI
jgi:hypothetical protein